MEAAIAYDALKKFCYNEESSEDSGRWGPEKFIFYFLFLRINIYFIVHYIICNKYMLYYSLYYVLHIMNVYIYIIIYCQ